MARKKGKKSSKKKGESRKGAGILKFLSKLFTIEKKVIGGKTYYGVFLKRRKCFSGDGYIDQKAYNGVLDSLKSKDKGVIASDPSIRKKGAFIREVVN